MKSILLYLKSPAIISSILVIPFMLLELINHRSLHEDFPVALFAFVWILPLAFLLLLMPVMRNARTGNGILANPIRLIISLAILIFIAALWVRLISDQMPCFLGVSKCD
jgi:hypothetical protein